MERTNVHLHADDKKELRKLAKKERVSVAHLIRRAIRELIERQKEGK